MQDRYVGDIGDFGKYGLLRFLCGKTGPRINNLLSLGVVWYFNSDGDSGGDSVGYLFRHFPPSECDWCLYDELKRLLCEDKRRVSDVERTDILPVDTENYFIEPVLPHRQREEWITRACNAISDHVELVFLDPDTGIRPKYPKNPAHEYARIDEINHFLNRNKSLVIYQHASRNRQTDLQRIRCLEKQLGRPVRAFEWESRYFLIIPSESNTQRLWNRLQEFRDSLWYGEDRFTEVEMKCPPSS